jgi:hypothetical protein
MPIIFAVGGVHQDLPSKLIHDIWNFCDPFSMWGRSGSSSNTLATRFYGLTISISLRSRDRRLLSCRRMRNNPILRPDPVV